MFYFNASAQCPLPGFNYSLPLTINNANAAVTDAQVKLTVNTATLVSAGKMQASGNDIRFTDTLCNTLPYWIESGMNTASTVIWVKVKNLASFGNVRIFMQYGSTSATAKSNGDSTFLLFDDFLGSTLNTTKWTYPSQSGSFSVGSGVISMNASSSMILYSAAAFPAPNKTEMNVTSLSGTYPCLGQAQAATTSNGVTMFSNGTMNLSSMSSGCNVYAGNFTNNTMTTGVGVWSLAWISSSVFKATWPGNGTYTSTSTSYTLTPTTNSSFGLLCSGGGSISVDWIRVRKNFNTEPTFTVGAELLNTKAYNDAGVAAFLNLQTKFCTGSQPVSVQVANYGSNAIGNLTVNWSVNNVIQTPFMYIGAIDTLGSTNGNSKNVTIGNYNFTNTPVSIKAWTSNPNSAVDTVRRNDTAYWSGSAGMGGTYTIGSGGSYNSFAAAVNAIQVNGLCGPVVFNVLPGTYYEQVNILNEILGASSTNTVTFNGSGIANCVLTYGAYLTGARHTVQISAADYVTFQNLTIQGSGTTYAWPVYITNSADNNTIKKCRIEITAPINGNTGTFNFMGVVVAGSQSGSPLGANIENLTLDSNTILSATCGIYTIANGSSGGHQYRGNSVLYCDRAIDVNSLRNVVISGNTINNRYINANLNCGIALNYVTPVSASDICRVTENKITNATMYGINIQSTSGLAQAKSLIANNMIGGGFNQMGSIGISMNYSNYWMVYHNSVNHNYAATSTYESPLYAYYCSNLSVVNNIFARTVSGSGEAIYTYGYVLDTFNSNILYVLPADSVNGIAYLNGTTLYPRTLYTMGSGNMYRAPGFTNDTVLTISNRCINGYPNTVVTRDIHGDLRSTPPDIGADELPSSGVDAEATAVLWPTSPANFGLSNIRVQFRNTGGSNLTSLRVNYRLNNGPLRSLNWTGNLATCDTTSISFTALQQGNFSQSINQLVAYVDLPNGSADPFPANDTVKTTIFLPLSGTYTLGGATADFPTFASAISMLRTAGVAGPVEFLVNPGTYTEQVIIDFNITGSSATNTVTFNGGDGNRNTRIISFDNTTYTYQSVVFLMGCKYVSFKNLTIQNNAYTSGYGYNVLMVGNTTRCNTIKSCRILQLSPSGQYATSTNYSGIILSSSQYSISNVKMDSITIDSNEISGGYYGIYNYALSGTPSLGNRIVNNSMSNIYYSGIYTGYQENIRINNNTISLIPTGVGYGIYAFALSTTVADYAAQIIGNRITGFGYAGINLSSSSNATTRKGIMANNVIGGNMLYQYAYGIYLSANTRWMIHHNSVNMTNQNSITNYAALQYASGTSISIVNNIFARTVAGSGHVFYSTTITGIDTFNYNHFYKLDTTGGLMYYTATRYPATFKNINGGNANSIFKPTTFLNDSNLQITDECNNGMIMTTVPTDVNGVIRNVVPDMGAYEILGIQNDIGVEYIHPLALPVASGPRQINIRLRNFGANIITSAAIKYSFNNGVPQTVNWSGSLMPCDTANIAFTVTIPQGFSRLRVYTQLPNNVTDVNMNNDTAQRVISTSLIGVYTIGGTTPDFINFTDAASALNVAGVSGPVVFNVRPGIYNEQIALNAIAGVSATNTVTFQAENGNKYSVDLRYGASTTTDNYVVKLNGATYVRFKHMTIRATSIANMGTVIAFANSAAQDSIHNCNLIGVNTLSTSGDLAIVAATGGRFDYVSLTSSKLINGSIGINFESTTTTNFMMYNNFAVDTFENQYYAGAVINTQILYTFRNCVITSNTSFNGYIGIYATYSQRGNINANKITIINGGAGIFQSNCDGVSAYPTWVTNNSISVNGANTSSYGIYSLYSNWQYFYGNSIHLYGAASYSYSVYLFYNTASYANNRFYNNIVSNSGGGYGYYVYNPAYCASDYNNYYASTPAYTVQTSVPNTSYNMLAWKNATRDAQSISYRPGFTSDLNLMPNAADSASWSVNGRALPQGTITTDINGAARSINIPSGTVDLGAYEFTPTSLPPAATATPALPAAGTTQLFLFGADTVASVTWAVGSPVPTVFTVRAYSGAIAPAITTGNYQFAYTKLDGTNGNYNYTMRYYFKDIWMGNVSTKSLLKLAKYNTTTGWSTDTTQIDATRNILTVTGIAKLNVFTGTNINNPLPVELVSLQVANKANYPYVTWTTATERNSAYFVVERSFDGATFAPIGKVKAAGNSNIKTNYAYTDKEVVLTQQVGAVYYRLRAVDMDNQSKESGIVSITAEQNKLVSSSVYPNPFNKNVNLTLAANKGEVLVLTLVDVNGKVLGQNTLEVTTQQQVEELNNLFTCLDSLSAGVYFVRIEGGSNQQTIKLIKY